jgi:hypothetical protein
MASEEVVSDAEDERAEMLAAVHEMDLSDEAFAGQF